MGEGEGVFVFEEDEAPVSHAPSTDSVLLAAHLTYLLKPASSHAARVARDVELCSLRLSGHSGGVEQCTPEKLATALAARGHAVSVLRAAGGGQGVAAFRKLRHTFLAISPPRHASPFAWVQQQQEEQEGELAAAAGLGCADALIVDPHFKCQFVLASPSPRFEALVSLLPQTFVGSMEQLEHVVEWVSREMQWSFKEAQQALPPWRELAAMLSKWQQATVVPRPGQKLPLAWQQAAPAAAPAGASPCGSPRAAGCCCCCQDGKGGAGAATAECTSGQRSPSSVLRLCSGGALFASTPVTPTRASEAGSESALQPRISLLSRSLEAAGLPARFQRVADAANWWEQPRTITVRRSA